MKAKRPHTLTCIQHGEIVEEMCDRCHQIRRFSTASIPTFPRSMPEPVSEESKERAREYTRIWRKCECREL